MLCDYTHVRETLFVICINQERVGKRGEETIIHATKSSRTARTVVARLRVSFNYLSANLLEINSFT